TEARWKNKQGKGETKKEKEEEGERGPDDCRQHHLRRRRRPEQKRKRDGRGEGGPKHMSSEISPDFRRRPRDEGEGEKGKFQTIITVASSSVVAGKEKGEKGA
ncbi:hypothetical protein U1Q18_037426, partial [Sarracenia purpurea var. burkii]